MSIKDRAREWLCYFGWHKWSAWEYLGTHSQPGRVDELPHVTVTLMPCHMEIHGRQCERCDAEEVTTLRRRRGKELDG